MNYKYVAFARADAPASRQFVLSVFMDKSELATLTGLTERGIISCGVGSRIMQWASAVDSMDRERIPCVLLRRRIQSLDPVLISLSIPAAITWFNKKSTDVLYSVHGNELREVPLPATRTLIVGITNTTLSMCLQGEKEIMNIPNKLTLNGALFAFLILSLAVSAWAQRVTGANRSLQKEAHEPTDRHSHRSPDADTTQRLLFWNEIALKASALDSALARPDQLGPLRSGRAFAIVHIAMFDAFNAIVGGFESYTDLDPASSDGDFDCDRSLASGDAAIAQAAGDTLIALFPFQANVIEALQLIDLKRIPNGPEKAAGRKIGRLAAKKILEKRSNDGSQQRDPAYNVPGGYIPNPALGKWRQDPIGKSPIALGALGNRVPPFVVRSADQFSAAPPPDLTSEAYAKAFDEVKRLGGDGVVTPTERTADQTIAGIFWAYDGAPLLGTPQRLYNQIAVKISKQMRTGGIELARLLALVNVAMADAGFACFTTKYQEEFWRPISGIRQGDDDNNPATTGDPNFAPLGAPASNTNGSPNFTPPFPSYTAGHPTFGSALFQILRRFYRTDEIAFTIISDEFNGITRDNQGNVRPLIPRRFHSLTQAEEENAQSRVYLGVHWSFDNTEGIKQGRQVGDYVFDNSFRRKTHRNGQTDE
jgi:vanadium-dependent haloperoxidase-like protein